MRLIFSAIVAATAMLPVQQASAQAQPFIGQISAFGFNFCPRGWAPASGQVLPIAQYQNVFSLIGTLYGGDGRTTFALPDLRNRAAIHAGDAPGVGAVRIGERVGTTSFTLTTGNLPSHTHSATGTMRANDGAAEGEEPEGGALATAEASIYATEAPNVDMAADTVTVAVANTGGSQPVGKRSPALAVTWCIAMQGVYPSRN